MKGSRTDKTRLRPVNRWIYLTARIIIGNLLLRYFRVRVENREAMPRTGGAIVVANHANFFDPMWLYSSLRRPMHFVATEELFRGRALRPLIRWFGTFAKRKAAQDFQTVKNMFTVIRSGGVIGLYPEGLRTWDGTNYPVIPTIARLIRKFRVPVVTCRFDGGYFGFPRWARKWRRIPVTVVFSRLYTKDDFPETDQEVVRDISAAIRIRDYDLEWEKPKRRISGLADGISVILYRCPSCATVEGLHMLEPASSNTFECSSCFSSWRIDPFCSITPLDESGMPRGEPVPLHEMYRKIKSMELRSFETPLMNLEPGERLFLMSRPRTLLREARFPYFRAIGFGRLFLTSRRLLFRTNRESLLEAPLDQLESLSIEPGNKLHFMHRGALYRLPFTQASPLKWQDAIESLLDTPLPTGL